MKIKIKKKIKKYLHLIAKIKKKRYIIMKMIKKNQKIIIN